MDGEKNHIGVLDVQTLRADALAAGLRLHGIPADSDIEPARTPLAVVHRDALHLLDGVAGVPYLILDPGQSRARPRADSEALAVLLPTGSLSQLATAINAALAGESIATSGANSTPTLEVDPEVAALSRLSGRESSVLVLIGRGLSNQQIGLELGISAHTVRTHVQNIFGKLAVTNRHAAVGVARRAGLAIEADRP